MKDSKKFLLIFILTIVATLWLFLVFYIKEEQTILLTIFFGAIFVVGVVAFTIEEFFPKNKISKKLEKFIDWIFENVNI